MDNEKLESDIAELIELYAFGTLKELEIGSLLHRIARVVDEHRLKGPRDFYLLAKALVTIESVGRELDPEFNAVNCETRRTVRRKVNHGTYEPPKVNQRFLSLRSRNALANA
ncbi:MAG: hypothetical protein U9O90_01135 [Euryarchaeota archaeon]|nr:hypothetical protein [Euryarchaeota archaeon]